MRALKSARSSHSYRVLCVDDNEFGVFVNGTILRSEGYDVLGCSDPVRAAEIATLEEIDVAVLDYQMPLMNGLQLAALCKAANPNIKVILFSGSLGVPSRELAFADLFIQKSEGPQALLDGMQALLIEDETRVESLSNESITTTTTTD